MFGNGRRRSFDRQNDNEQNSTGYREKTVFSTDFGVPDSNYQNAGYPPVPSQNNGFGESYSQEPMNNVGGYAQNAQQSYGAQQGVAAPTAVTQASDLPMVFASRKHSDIYVYEYRDRVEWYLKTATCMHLFNIEKKGL